MKFSQSETEQCFFNTPENFSHDENFQNNVAHVAQVARPTIDLSLAVDAATEQRSSAIATADRIIATCKANPGALMSAEFLEAIKVIRAEPELWASYRVKIKKEKPSGILLSDIDDATRLSSDDEGGDSVAGELINLVTEQGELFFDSHADTGFVEVEINGITNVLAIGRKSFVEWLSYEYYSSTKAESRNGNGKSASEAAIKQACFALAGIAKHDGETAKVFMRVADHGGGHYIFMADERLRVIEVTSTGWRILDKSPIKFWKPAAMQPLPEPKPGGNLERLWEFANIPENERLLVIAWILESWRSETPFPILALSGGQGSAKSSTQSKLRELVDHNAVNLRAAPKSVEDVFVSAGQNWLASFENISHLTPAMQDALCTLATGGGYASRTLFTNSEESIIEAKRPVIINSIPNVVTAQDLTDRAISVELPRIEYREESEIAEQWEAAKGEIIGGLLDLFVKTLALIPKVKLTHPPRMADFTRLGEAVALAMGKPAGTFDTLYKANRSDSVGRALESSPVAVAITEMVDRHCGHSPIVFHGTVEALRQHLEQFKRDTENWPRSARGLSDTIKRQSPALNSLGIHIETGRRVEKIGDSRGIPITIKKAVQQVQHVQRRFESFASEKNFSADSEVF